MKKAGGIIALVAGIFGILAAGITLFIGGIGGATGADFDAGVVIELGWGGVLFSFLTIVFSAVCMGGASSKTPGILLIICSILGVIFGGAIVAIFMVLALIGGILALFGGKNQPATTAS